MSLQDVALGVGYPKVARVRSRHDFVYIQASPFKYRISCGVVAMRPPLHSGKKTIDADKDAVDSEREGRRVQVTEQVTDTGYPSVRLGITVTKKVGNAPLRNRWKRVIREAFRLSRVSWSVSKSVDMVVIVKPGAKFPSPNAMQHSLNSAVRRWEKVSRGKS